MDVDANIICRERLVNINVTQLEVVLLVQYEGTRDGGAVVLEARSTSKGRSALAGNNSKHHRQRSESERVTFGVRCAFVCVCVLL